MPSCTIVNFVRSLNPKNTNSCASFEDVLRHQCFYAYFVQEGKYDQTFLTAQTVQARGGAVAVG